MIHYARLYSTLQSKSTSDEWTYDQKLKFFAFCRWFYAHVRLRSVLSMLSLLSTRAFWHCALWHCVWLVKFFFWAMHAWASTAPAIQFQWTDWSGVHVNQVICHHQHNPVIVFVYITWRSGAVIGFATSQADNHGFTWAKNPVCSSFGKFELLPIVGLLCWLVLRRAPKINASAITTSPGPGRILTSGSGSAVLAWCKHDWDALATRNDIVA